MRRMALFGEVFTADEALALCLVDRMVPTGEGIAAADEAAARLRSRASELNKMLINAAEGEELAQGLAAFARSAPGFRLTFYR